MTDRLLTMSDIKAIAKAVAKEMGRGNSYLIAPSDVAEMMGYSTTSSMIEKILRDPTFPAPVEITEGGHRRYRRHDVVAWIDRKVEAGNDAAFAAASRNF